jgi:hypothetical protein
MPMPDDFLYLKNPYHLFHHFQQTTLHKNQKTIAQDLREKLPKNGVPRVGEGNIGDLLKPDYIDFFDHEALRAHLPAMNGLIEENLSDQTIDLALPKSRAAIARSVGYQYPTAKDLEANLSFDPFRGIWQVLHPSVQHRHVPNNEGWVRIAALIFYGFITERDSHRIYVDLLVIGPTSIWQSRASIGRASNKLYIHGYEFRRDVGFGSRENQFLVFDPIRIRDSELREQVNIMSGLLAGTVLDSEYESFPVFAVPCVARKLKGWSAWFLQNDDRIDPEFINTLRRNLGLTYEKIADLRERSHEDVPREQAETLAARKREGDYGLNGRLQYICRPDGSLTSPILQIPNPVFGGPTGTRPA